MQCLVIPFFWTEYQKWVPRKLACWGGTHCVAVQCIMSYSSWKKLRQPVQFQLLPEMPSAPPISIVRLHRLIFCLIESSDLPNWWLCSVLKTWFVCSGNSILAGPTPSGTQCDSCDLNELKVSCLDLSMSSQQMTCQVNKWRFMREPKRFLPHWKLHRFMAESVSMSFNPVVVYNMIYICILGTCQCDQYQWYSSDLNVAYYLWGYYQSVLV